MYFFGHLCLFIRDTFYSLGMILTEEKSTPSSELSELTETPNFWFIFNNIYYDNLDWSRRCAAVKYLSFGNLLLFCSYKQAADNTMLENKNHPN